MREFVVKHKHNFKVIWFKADHDGDLGAITSSELIDYCTETNMLEVEHFFPKLLLTNINE